MVFPLSGADLFGFGNPGAYDYFELEIRDYKSTFTTSFIFHMHDVYQNGIGTYNIDISNGMQDIDGLNNNYIHCTIYNSTKKNYQKYVSYNNSGTFTITRLTPSTGSGLIISGEGVFVAVDKGTARERRVFFDGVNAAFEVYLDVPVFIHKGKDILGTGLKAQLDMAISHYEDLVFEARSIFDTNI